MKNKKNVLEKILHFSENTTMGLFGREREIENTSPKSGSAHSGDRRYHTKHFNLNPNWNAKRRKTIP